MEERLNQNCSSKEEEEGITNRRYLWEDWEKLIMGAFWKGGSLKFEKAKEHYLVRLRREWAEDGELAVSQPSDSIDKNTNIVSSDKPKKLMKSLPFSGTGKHEYSFQRIEVPSLPTHFCDCEEHSDPPHTAQKQYFCDREPQSGGMNEEELNMMNSVMNKIFERETDLKVAYHVTGLTKGGHDSLQSTNEQLIDDNESDHAADEDELQVDDNESDLAEDEDNVVINMFTGFNDTWTSTSGYPMIPAVSSGSKHHDQVKQHTSETIRDGNEKLEVGKGFTTTSSSDMVALDEEHNFVDLDVEKSTPEKGVQMIGNNEVSALTLRKKPHIAPKKTSVKDVKIGETCSFMRTAASVKEWNKTKAALSGSLKKK
ncbi:hypothetical protein PVL29_009199 [Vitis rotundifolia]|uniref:Uncharacterized protein n=1 Tax=Vitis rotundifolia TaxID=103349 RepID=A0AA39DV59_VITRO|nr:hypothetical protein PVL29_009199 [Vitis rotundifolia]